MAYLDSISAAATGDKAPVSTQPAYSSRFRGLLAAGLGCVLFAGACSPAPEPRTALDLAGQWTFRPGTCLSGESACEQEIAIISETDGVPVSVPANLRTKFPNFYGQGRMTREFRRPPGATAADNFQLLLGGIGSVDRVYLNGILIGQTGLARFSPGDSPTPDAESFASAWNTVRLYNVPARLLRENNRIEIEFFALDVKAGLHRGPVLLGPPEQLRGPYWFARILFEDLFIAETILIFFVWIFFVVNALGKRMEAHFNPILWAFLAYGLHSLYYIELPIALNHLWFLKFQWACRVLSVVFAHIYILNVSGVTSRIARHGGFFANGAGLVMLALARDYQTYFIFAALIQAGFVLQILFFEVLPFARMARDGSGDRNQIRELLLTSLLVIGVYSLDLLVRVSWSNLPWLYHYLALLNALQFLIYFIHSLHSYKIRAREYELKLAGERFLIAREIHDTIGADLGEIVVHSRAAKVPDGAPRDRHIIQELATRSLDNLRDIVGLLKQSDSEIKNLARAMDEFVDRLRLLDTCTVETRIEPIELPAFQSLQMQRVFSEWMSNVLRHSEPGRLVISLRRRGSSCVLGVFDDGRGLAWRGEIRGSGLTHIAGRVRGLGGRLRAVRDHGRRGWNVFYCAIPCP